MNNKSVKRFSHKEEFGLALIVLMVGVFFDGIIGTFPDFFLITFSIFIFVVLKYESSGVSSFRLICALALIYFSVSFLYKLLFGGGEYGGLSYVVPIGSFVLSLLVAKHKWILMLRK